MAINRQTAGSMLAFGCLPIDMAGQDKFPNVRAAQTEGGMEQENTLKACLSQ